MPLEVTLLVLLAALSKRTKQHKFGPLVYLLPIYHPLRLVEEVAMLDALSNGRLQLGVGPGASLIEMGFFGLEEADRRKKNLVVWVLADSVLVR